MQDGESIGARIASERKLRGLTQLALANRSAVSLSLLRKVEQGSKPASPGVVAAVSRALRIEPGRLTGQPYYSGERNTDALHDLIPDLRRELTLHGVPPDDDPDAEPTLASLTARVSTLSDQLYAVDYARAGAALPALLVDLRWAAATMTSADLVEVLLLQQEAYDVAKRITWDLGYPDLGLVAVSNEERAALESGDELALAVARAVRAWSLTSSGSFEAARSLLTQTIDAMEPTETSQWAVWGFLHLQAALGAARAGDPIRAWDHHTEAARAAGQIRDVDPDWYRLSFNQANTAIWGVGLAVEMLDGAAALARADAVHLEGTHLPASRVGHHFIDLARGQLLHGDQAGALGSLLTARRVAPDQVRYNPMVRETVYQLARNERRASESLRGLAVWMGVPD